MQKSKKAAFLVYPEYCNWEIALALATLNMHDIKVDVIALDGNPVPCEEGIKIIPDKTLDEFNANEYGCILLSGIGGNPDDVLYNAAYTDFLRQFVGNDKIVLAAISLAPALLGKAGLLKGKKFCVGMYEEDRDELNFFEYENRRLAPVVVDGNVITAVGKAFREFAIAIAERLGHPCRRELWGEIQYPINPDDYIFRMDR